MATPVISKRRRYLLIGGFVIALVVTLFFGFRLVRRILFRPSREPIREWMDVGYIARAYGIPPPRSRGDHRHPLWPTTGSQAHRRDRPRAGKTAAELVELIQARINKGPPYSPRPTRQPAPTPPPPS
ncbi:MAG: hypothetical protein HC853_15535 [Anaerolineae bacterium]|nr:hypothetical protein [Anaerolineae bacterium]